MAQVGVRSCQLSDPGSDPDATLSVFTEFAAPEQRPHET